MIKKLRNVCKENIFVTQTVVQYFCIVYLNRSRRKPIAIIASSKKEGKIESSCSLSGISLPLSLSFLTQKCTLTLHFKSLSLTLALSPCLSLSLSFFLSHCFNSFACFDNMQLLFVSFKVYDHNFMSFKSAYVNAYQVKVKKRIACKQEK
jgi:hypothetical protein